MRNDRQPLVELLIAELHSRLSSCLPGAGKVVEEEEGFVGVWITYLVTALGTHKQLCPIPFHSWRSWARECMHTCIPVYTHPDTHRNKEKGRERGDGQATPQKDTRLSLCVYLYAMRCLRACVHCLLESPRVGHMGGSHGGSQGQAWLPSF
jgi:hypothetical protein